MGFPPKASVSLTYEFGGTPQLKTVVASEDGHITNDMTIPEGYKGSVRIVAKANKTKVTLTQGAPAPKTAATSSIPQERTSVETTETASALKIDPNGEQFYIDCNVASGGDGSKASPWKNPTSLNGTTLPAGAVVNFQRGCSWDGRVTVSATGSATSPVVLRADPASTGSAPSLSATAESTVNIDEAIMTVESPYVGVEGLHFTKNHGIGVKMSGAFGQVVNVAIDNVGLGIWFGGDNGIASGVHIRDLHMVRSTSGGDDDFGAVGFNVEATNVTVENSSCTNCIDESPDYGYDGGFVEVWKKGDGLRVINNVSKNTDGFFEAGGEGGGDSANNLLFAGNSIDECRGVGMVLHTTGKFSIAIQGIRLENNTIVDAKGEFYIGNSSLVTSSNNTLNGKPLVLG